MSEFTHKQRLLVTVVPVVVLAVVALLSFVEFLKLGSTRRLITHSHLVIEAVRGVSSDIAEAEAGQRGYLLTGEDAYLPPYLVALGELSRDTAALRALVRDNPEQAARADTLALRIAVRIRLLRQNIDLRRGGGPGVITSRSLDSGQVATASIRAVGDRFEAAEQGLLAARMRAETERHWTLALVFVFGMGLAAVLAYALNRALAGYAAAQLRALGRIEEQNDELQHQAAQLQEQAAILEEQRAEVERQRDDLEEQAAEQELLNQELAERTMVTERAHEATEAERRRTAEILESISDAFYLVDRDWRLRWANTQAAQLLGRERAEILGQEVWDLMPEPKARLSRRFREAMRSGKVVRFDQYLPAQGGYFAVALYPSPSGLSALFHDVTEGRLREAEMRVLREAIPQLVWAARADGTTDYYNERWFEYTGMPRTARDTWVWEHCVHPDDVEHARDAWRQAAKSGRPYEVEYRLRRGHDRAYRWFLGRATAARAPDGTILRWFGTCTDIHEERVAAEAVHRLSGELKVRVEELETLFQILPVGVAVSYDPECRDMRVNPALAETLRVSRDENISQDRPDPEVLPFVTTKDGVPLPNAELPMQAAARLGRPVEDMAFEISFRDGDVAHLFGSAVPLRDEKGGVRGAIGAFVDMTDRVRTEAEIHRLGERAAKLYAFTGQLARALTLDEVAAIAGEWGREVLGAVASTVAALDGDVLRPLHMAGLPSSFVERWRTIPLAQSVPMTEAVRRNQVVALRSRAERVAVAPHMDWPEGLGAMMAGPVVFEERTLGAWAIHFDGPRDFSEEDIRLFEAVTNQCAQALERARLFEAERRAREEAEQANQAKLKFLRVMSHDLRTPLNAILGYTELLQQEVAGPIGEMQRTYLDRILASTAILRTLIDDILEFARIEAGHVDIRAGDLVLTRVLEDLEAVVGPQVHAKGITLRLATCEDYRVRADRERTRQVLMNIVSNAQKFTPEGGEIVIECEGDDGCVRVHVHDNGVGIPPEELERIFEPFVQVHRPAELGIEQGVGLGLAISRELARAMGGDVIARERPGGGSTFTLTLPRARRPAETEAAVPV